MAGDVGAHESAPVGQSVGEGARAREEQQVRCPHEATGEHDGVGRDRDAVPARVGGIARRPCNAPRARIRLEPAHEDTGDQLDLLCGNQCIPRPVGRVLGTCRTDGITRVATLTDRPPLICHGVLRRRRTPRRDVCLRCPLLQCRQVHIERQRRQRIWLSSRVVRRRPLHASDAQALLGFLQIRIERVIVDGPVVTNAVERTKAEVLGRIPRRHPTPVHRESAHHHRGRVPPRRADRVLIVQMIALPRTLAVGEPPLTRASALRERGRVSPRFDHHDAS